MLINMRHHCGHFKNTKKTFFVILSLFYIIIDQSIYRVLSFSFKISAKTRNYIRDILFYVIVIYISPLFQMNLIAPVFNEFKTFYLLFHADNSTSKSLFSVCKSLFSVCKSLFFVCKSLFCVCQ